MAGLNLQLLALTLPEGTEFPGTPQGLINLISAYMAIGGAENFVGVAYGDTEPDADSRDLWWARTDGSGNPIGWYAWDGAAWSPLPITIPSGATADRPSSPPDGTLYFDTDISVELIYSDAMWRTASGSPGDVKFVKATTLADALEKNPGWSQDPDSVGRVIAGASDGTSDGDYGDTAGSDQLTLTEAELPSHTHEDLVLTGSEADNGDVGNLVVTAATQNIGQRTITNSQTGPKGDGAAFDNRQATIYYWTLYKL